MHNMICISVYAYIYIYITITLSIMMLQRKLGPKIHFIENMAGYAPFNRCDSKYQKVSLNAVY